MKIINSKFRIKHLILRILLTLLPATSLANTGYIAELQEKAIAQKLWKNQEWLNLMHYDVHDRDNDEYESQVDDERFFHAEDGKTNSKAELLETIAAYFRTDVKDNEHPRCKFIARLEWLKEKISLDENKLPAMDCKDYIEWRDLVKSERVTMIFPAYHLNSPSSMFGHTLLRLDKKFGNNKSDWLSYAVNFGAETSDEDNSIFYAYKGLAGGYPGIFIVQPYFKKIQEYNRIENRDIWEYQLNLTPEETDKIMRHLWELKEMEFDYFFFDENCSYRLLELIEVGRPGVELTDDFDLTAIPVDTVRAIERADLIESIEYRPSQATALQHLIDQMSDKEKSLVMQASEDYATIESDEFNALPEDRQHMIVDAAYKFIRYEQTREVRDPAMAKRSHQLLQKLSSYPAKAGAPDYNIPTAPENSHESRRLSIGGGKRLDKGFAELGYKFSFHDLDDNEHGFLRGAQINIGTATVRIDKEGTARLHKLDLVDIFSITPRTDFIKPLSWRVYTGYERQPTPVKDKLVSHVTAGAGVSYDLWQDSQMYSMATLRLEHNTSMDSTIEPAIGATTGLLHHFGWSTVHLELSGERFNDDIYRTRSVYKHNFVISTNHSLKITAAREWHSAARFSEFNLSYQYYFY